MDLAGKAKAGFLTNSGWQTPGPYGGTLLAGEAGGSAAVPIRYRVRSWLYIVAAPGLVQKGYSMNRTDSLSGEYDQRTNAYLQLPIGVSFSHGWGRHCNTGSPVPGGSPPRRGTMGR